MTRRSFCQRLVLLGAASLTAPISPGSAQSDREQPKFTLCLNPGAIGVRASQPEAILLAGRHGFGSVEPMAGALEALEANALENLLGSLREHHLAWGSAGLPVDFRGSDSTFSDGLQALPRAAAALQRAGVSRVNTWISPGSGRLTYSNNFRLHQDRLRQVADILKDHGQNLGLEYVGTHTSLIRSRYPFIHTLAEIRDLIAAIDTGNVGVVLDSWHAWQAGDTPEDLRTLRNQDIIAVDLNDAPKGVDPRAQKDGERELPAATGVIEIGAFLQSLMTIGYDGPVRAEPFNRALNDLDNDAACAATIEALRRAVGTATAAG